MAIIQVKSTNPHFSFVIRKNPVSGMLIRSIRKGLAYGWYTDESCFNVYFKDADNEVSYKKDANEDFEYLNVSRYNTPLFPMKAISEFFSSAFKEQQEQDEHGFHHQFFINMIHIERMNYFESFKKHFPDCEFTCIHQAHKSYSLTIGTTKSIYYLLHVVNVFCVFMSMFAPEYLDLSDATLVKSIRSVNVIDAPFYIRNLFAINFLSSRACFSKFKAELEKTDRYKIDFVLGGTGNQRRNFIREQLSFDKGILDVGCGEGLYATAFASKLEDHYYAVDIDPECLEIVEKRAAKRQIENILLYSSLEEFLATYNEGLVDVILTEVIEHMSLEEAKRLIRKLIKQVNFETMVITTPNADFNQFYEVSGMRHDDHKWEMGKSDFEKWISEVLAYYPYTYTFVAIGDSVNEITTTQGVIVKRGAKNEDRD